jgi:hypothetical protein
MLTRCWIPEDLANLKMIICNSCSYSLKRNENYKNKYEDIRICKICPILLQYMNATQTPTKLSSKCIG